MSTNLRSKWAVETDRLLFEPLNLDNSVLSWKLVKNSILAVVTALLNPERRRYPHVLHPSFHPT